MSDQTKDLLTKFKVDTSAFKDAITQVRALLKQADAEDQTRQRAAKAAQEASLASIQKEISIRQTISKATKAAVDAETGRVTSIRAVASESAKAASAQLSATRAQIAAEKEKGEAIQSALSKQKLAAANSIAYEKAYQAQVASAAQTKAKAAAIFDNAYRAQVAEVQKNKKLEVQPRAPQAEYSSVPLITSEQKQIVEEQSGRRRSAATGKYIGANSNEPAITAAAQAAQVEQAAIASTRRAEEQLGAEINAIINRTNAANKIAAAEKQALINEELVAQERLGEQIIAITNRTTAERVAAERKVELAQRKSAAEAAKLAREKAERPSFLNLIKEPAVGALGGEKSVLGGLAGGLLSGFELGAGIAAFTALQKAISGTVEKMKEFIEDSGGLQKVTSTFQNLAEGKGYDGGQFLEDLQNKTQHLVSEVDLLRVANTFMQSGLKVSQKDMLDLTEATVGLARGQGKDATQAIQALTRTFLTGGRGAMALARIVGIQGPALMLRGFSSTEGMAARQQATFENMAKVIKQRYEEMGAPAITYTDRLKQVSVVSTELYEHLAQGAVKSPGFATLMASLGNAIARMGGLENAAEKLGNTIGNAFTPLSAVFEALLPTLGAVANAFGEVAATVSNLFGAFLSSNDPVDKLADNFAKLHPVLDITIKSISAIALLISDMANGVSFFAQVTNKALSLNVPSSSSQEYQDWRAQKHYPGEGKGQPEIYQQFSKDWKEQHPSDQKSYSDLVYDYNDRLTADTDRYKDSTTGIVKSYSHFENQQYADTNSLRTGNNLPLVLPEDKAKADTWETKTVADVKEKQAQLETQITAIRADKSLGDLGQTAKITDLTKATNTSIEAIKQKNAKDLGLTYHSGVVPTTSFNEQGLERRHANQLAIARMGDEKATAQAQLEDAKNIIAQEEEYNERMYKTGKEAAQDYYDGKKQFADETLNATLADNKKEEASDRAVLTEKLKHKDIFPDVSEKDFDKITEQYKRKNTQAQQTHTSALAGATLGAQEESNKVAKEQIENNLKFKLDALADEKDAVENSFKEQQISAEDYYNFQIAYIKEVRDSNIQAINDQIATNGDYSDSNIALYKQLQQLAHDATKQIQDLNEAKINTAVQDIGTRQSSRVGEITALQTGQENPLSKTTASQQGATQQQLIDSTTAALSQYNFQLVLAAQSGLAGSKTWNDIVTKIQQANNELDEQLLKQQQIANASTVTGQAATLGAAGSTAFGNVFGGRYAKGLESAIGGGAATAQGAQGFVNQASSGFGALSSSNSISDNLSAFTKGLQGAIQAVGSFASAIANAGSASAGALGGALGGAGLGQAAGSAAQSLAPAGSALAGLGSAAGPLGALVGAGIGAALGGIMGQKQEEVQDDINQLTANFKGIMNQYSANNASLNTTIASLTVLVAEAQAEQASTKKGGSQFTSLIQQYNEQIVQLEDQQTQIMAQLNQQLTIASSPTAYQAIISSIQQVLQQYTSFVGAASNATELANANNYLTQSLQNLAVGYSDQVNQGQQQAIQDALSLNQLYNQRNQLEYQYLQQVQSIQGQGTLTRGITQSQSKFSQLYNLDVQTSNQLLDINAQINLAQYQVTAAQQIFSLATTQVGLQTQLLNLQEVGINEDMQRLGAMQNVLQLLQQTGYSLTSLGTLNTSDPNALLTLLLQLLAGQLGVNVGGVNNPTGLKTIGHLDTLAAGAYSARASYGFGNFRSANL